MHEAFRDLAFYYYFVLPWLMPTGCLTMINVVFCLFFVFCFCPGYGSRDDLQGQCLRSEREARPVVASQKSSVAAGSRIDAAVWSDHEGCYRFLLPTSTHCFRSCTCSGIYSTNYCILNVDTLWCFHSFRLCAKAADCTSQARSTWNSSGECPYPASPAETAPRQPLQEARVAHPQAHTPLNRILKSPQCQRRRESPTGRSVPTSTKVLVTSHFLFTILRDSPTNKIKY